MRNEATDVTCRVKAHFLNNYSDEFTGTELSQSFAKKVFSWVDDHKSDIADFCCNYIRYRSENPPGLELEVQKDFIYPFFKQQMNWTSIDFFSVDKDKKRPNVTGILKGSGGEGKNLILNGHSDVVPVPDATAAMWKTAPYEPMIVRDNIYGRGANDMKGGNTAAIWAVKAMMDNEIKLKGTVCVEIVSGEESLESRTIGTKPATERLIASGIKPDFVIVVEPTMCEIHTVSCSTFDFTVHIDGKDAHTCMRNVVLYPQRYGVLAGEQVGVDAVSRLTDILKIFERLERQWVMRWKHEVLGGGGCYGVHDFQGTGVFTINPSFIRGGTYLASIPGYAWCQCQVYHPSWVSHEEVWAEIKRAIDSYCSTDDWLKDHPPKLTWGGTFKMKAYETDLRHPGCKALGEALEEATGKPAIFSGFKALDDLTWIQEIDPSIPGVSLGPGDLSMGAHGPNEYVPIDHIIKCCKTYAAMMINWCGLAEA